MVDFYAFVTKCQLASHGVLPVTIPVDKYVMLDLSSKNTQLTEAVYETPQQFEVYIDTYLKENEALVAYGGYGEVRNLYQSSSLFDNEVLEDIRNIHLGIDFWCPAQTAIITPWDGVVHSFQNNTSVGDYGPTIILEHHILQTTFYTLYGHLSIASIDALEIGVEFKGGVQIGSLGDVIVNGGYAPHLHFQVIKDITSYKGDYPGVSSKKNLESFLQNCPDPLLLLGI